MMPAAAATMALVLLAYTRKSIHEARNGGERGGLKGVKGVRYEEVVEDEWAPKTRKKEGGEK